MALLEASGIGKNFGDTHVLKDISLTLEQGEALAIIGSSGSGKTTLLRCLNFLERPDTGVIKVNGETMWDAADPATQRESEVRKKRLHFGLVFQNFNLFPQYTALQNVMLAGELLAKERPDYKARKKAIHAELEQQRAEQIAEEWSRAMQEGRNGSVRDFVSVGDVSIKAIGADNQILDSETPVRQILEQLVAKTGLPPFMLGLSWSSTERMSSQQADMLTSEITALRRTLEPVIERVCTLWLRMHGYGCRAVVDWEDINLQDEVEEAKAALYLQQARKLRQENDEAEGK